MEVTPADGSASTPRSGRLDSSLSEELSSASLRPRLLRLAFRFVWNRDDAEDVVQEALANAHHRRDELRDQGRWWSWLCRILIHRCHEHGRSKKRREKHESALQLDARDRAATDLEGHEERKELVRRLLHELPGRQREVMVLRHLQQMPYAEIAEILGISPVTARVHAQKGREALREKLLEVAPELGGPRPKQ